LTKYKTGQKYIAGRAFRQHLSDKENHPPPIIDKGTFDRVQEMTKLRSNIEFDEHGNKVRKNIHNSMKQIDNKAEEPPNVCDLR
jgi:hypothetical protein